MQLQLIGQKKFWDKGPKEGKGSHHNHFAGVTSGYHSHNIRGEGANPVPNPVHALGLN